MKFVTILIAVLLTTFAVYSQSVTFPQNSTTRWKKSTNTGILPDTVTTAHNGLGSTSYFVYDDIKRGTMSITARFLTSTDTLNGYHVWLEGCNDNAGLTWSRIPSAFADSLADTVTTGLVLKPSISKAWVIVADFNKYRLVYQARRGGIIRVDVWSAWKRFYNNANLNN